MVDYLNYYDYCYYFCNVNFTYAIFDHNVGEKESTAHVDEIVKIIFIVKEITVAQKRETVKVYNEIWVVEKTAKMEELAEKVAETNPIAEETYDKA